MKKNQYKIPQTSVLNFETTHVLMLSGVGPYNGPGNVNNSSLSGISGG